MNIDPNGKGWIDWAATKVSAVHLDGGGAGTGAGPGVVRGGTHTSLRRPAALRPHQHFTRHGAIPPLQPGKGVRDDLMQEWGGRAGNLPKSLVGAGFAGVGGKRQWM